MNHQTSLAATTGLTLALFLSSANAQHCENGVCHINPRNRDTNFLLPSLPARTPSSPMSNAAYESDCPDRLAPALRDNRLYREFDFTAPDPRVNDYEPPISQPTAIHWETEFERGERLSRRTGRPMLVRVTADWCGHCTHMKQTTYRHRGITQDVNGAFIAIELNVDRNQDLVEQMGVKSLPATLVITPDRRIVAREQGYRNAEQLSKTLRRFMQRAELVRPLTVAIR